MKMFNFDFMKGDSGKPMEAVNFMMRSLDEAKNRCRNLFADRGVTIGANRVHLRENGGSKILFGWPEET